MDTTTTTEAAGASVDSLRDAFGLDDMGLSDLKDPGTSCLNAPAEGSVRRKRVKLTHEHFFEHETGFKKVLKAFPDIQFKGKGKEFEDLSVLLQHYQRWFKDLLPQDENFEDLAYKARSVLSEREKTEDNIISDPRERLHMLRFKYKESQRAAAIRAAGGSVELPDDMKARIEANKRRALELKAKKAAAAGSAATFNSNGANAAPADEDPWSIMPPEDEFMEDPEEDVFGFGFGMDDDDGPPPPRPVPTPQNAPLPTPSASEDQRQRIAENRARAQALKQQKQSRATASTGSGGEPPSVVPSNNAAPPPVPGTMLDEEDDAFMFPPAEFEEEDVFGFGGNMDDEYLDNGGRQAETKPPPPPAPVPIDEEMLRRIQENKAKAIGMRKQRELEAAHIQFSGEAARVLEEATRDLADICNEGATNHITDPVSTLIDTRQGGSEGREVPVVQETVPVVQETQPEVAGSSVENTQAETPESHTAPEAGTHLGGEADDEDDDIILHIEEP